MKERLNFRPHQRLRHDRDFRRILAAGRRAEDSRLIVYVDESPTEPGRLGMRAGRRLGSAVLRNRMRRLVREAYRLAQHRLPRGLDALCVLKAASQATLEDYRTSLLALIEQARRRKPRRRAAHPEPEP
jgi:ribonuclease P protein component